MPQSRKWSDLDRQVNNALLKTTKRGDRLIIREYSRALKQIRNEMAKLYTRVAGDDGVLTLAQMTKYNRMQSLEKNIIQIMNQNHGIVVAHMDTLARELYNASFFDYAWAFDQNSGVAITWGTVPQEALEAITNNPFDLIAKDTLKTVQRNKIRTAISQGLIQGQSFPQMMRGVRQAMGSATYQAMRIARTEGQRAQNEGTDEIYGRAVENGAEGSVIWDATLDGRTRPSHRAKDGEVRAQDGRFSPLGGERPRYPTDPILPAKEAINCRCRLRFQVDGYAPQLRRTRDQGVIPYTTFNDWSDNLNAQNQFVGTVPAPGAFNAT